MEKIITVQNLRKAYKKETAVENVCFELMPGDIMGLLGTNGAGKTTTLKMITNLCAKDNGQIVIDNISLDTNPELALSKVGAALDSPSFYQELPQEKTLNVLRFYTKIFLTVRLWNYLIMLDSVHSLKRK